MTHGKITITFEHYWHCGSGQAGEGDVDLLPVVEDCGLPYVPGRAIRGRLKWAAREAGWNNADLQALFGKEDARSLETMGRLQLSSGRMMDGFASAAREHFRNKRTHHPQVASLFEDIASTSMKNGVAQAKSLRRVRYSVPVIVVADVSLIEDPKVDVTWNRLQQLVTLLLAIGKSKHDGFGWCRATLAEIDSSPEQQETLIQSKAYDLELTLLDDAVLSANSATVGGHRTLDHVPGSSLMGAAAKHLFKTLKENQAAEALLLGTISFGNAVPVGSDGSATIPVPLAWHYAKGDSVPPVEEDIIKPDQISNLSAIEYSMSRLASNQPVQMREGWLDPEAGRLIRVPRTQTLKTAISPSLAKYETAQEGALYGYEAIAKGGIFVSRIELSTDNPKLHQTLMETFHHKTIRMGRSKGTEFGRAKCVLKPVGPVTSTAEVPREFALLAESDLALMNDLGFPTLKPTPSHFGLGDKWNLCEKQSYLRFRRYSLWNAKRGGPDIERQVVSKGSVLIFKGGEVGEKVALRVGFGQSEGLGRVRLVDLGSEKCWMGSTRDGRPFFTHHGKPIPDSAPYKVANTTTEDLTVWINDRHNEKQFDIQAMRLAREWGEQWKRIARRQKAAISASQWGRLDDVARECRDIKELIQRLGDPEIPDDNTIFGHGRKQQEWKKGEQKSLAHAVRECIGRETAPQLELAAFRAACRLMASDKRQERNRNI
ncbi:MAG: RAMP superfamily CRISPR-associated protein [Candidatus Methylacidiphilales bacterium]|nr:RAMP superfamily CRISPR-associated protein [Candidatus Methylacidiphilales bacterium]